MQAIPSRRAAQMPERVSKLSLYRDVPAVEVNLDDLERCGLARLRVLKEIDAARVRGLKGDVLNRVIKDVLLRELPIRKETFEEDLRRDRLSHFILRLAFADSEEHRRWFIEKECALFRLRFLEEDTSNRLRFIQTCNFDFVPITPEHLSAYQTDLETVYRLVNHLRDGEPVPHDFFEIPFQEVPEYVAQRRVLVKRGIAFVPQSDVTMLVVGRFRQNLAREMAVLGRKFPVLAASESDRLFPLLRRLIMHDPAQNRVSNEPRSDKVSLASIDQLARQSFPLCMRHLHNTLRTTHHLKHGGRMQYGLFLKGIGLTMEESMEFWKSEFTHVMPSDKFDKEHAYNIRHNYGMEGKRVSYSPYSCQTIINGQRGPDEAHGCPFKHFETERLAVRPAALRAPTAPGPVAHRRAQILLREVGIADEQQRDVLDLTRGHHYEIACQRVFELTHPGYTGAPVTGHPNHYFDASMRYHREAAARAAGLPIKSEPAAAAAAVAAGAAAPAGAAAASAVAGGSGAVQATAAAAAAADDVPPEVWMEE